MHNNNKRFSRTWAGKGCSITNWALTRYTLPRANLSFMPSVWLVSPPEGGNKCFTVQETKINALHTMFSTPYTRFAWKVFLEAAVCKVGHHLLSGDRRHVMWYKDCSDVTPSAFLARFQTPGGLPWHQSAASVCLLLCQLDVLFLSVSSASENISIVVLLFGLVVSALSDPSCITVWQTSHKKPVGKGRQKLFGEINVLTELPKK